jgi:hypothetical protein
MFQDLLFNVKCTFLIILKLYCPIAVAIMIKENWMTINLFQAIIYTAFMACLFVLVFYDYIKPQWRSSNKHE